MNSWFFIWVIIIAQILRHLTTPQDFYVKA